MRGMAASGRRRRHHRGVMPAIRGGQTLAKDRLAGRAGARKPTPFLYNASF